MPAHSPDHNQPLIISYLTLRKAVGILGIILPFLLMIGFKIFNKNCAFPPSISHFYYTDMGNWFVGTLCAVALFMFCYNGHDLSDKVASKLAATFALLTAMFPTNFTTFMTMSSCSRIREEEANQVANLIHYISASLLFATFAYFSLIEFTKSNKRGMMGKQKKKRNTVYRICGWVIVGCITTIAVISFVDDLNEKLKNFKPTFVLETLALIAFGFSWLVKGETIFKDLTPHPTDSS
jgi:uncharacterized membrane protein